MPIKFVGEHFCVSKEFWLRNFSCIGGGITVLSKFFVSQDENEKLCKGTLLLSRKIFVSKKIWIRGGISRFSVEFFMSHSAEKFCKRMQMFLRKLLVSKSFMDEKGGGGFHVFSSKTLGPTVPKMFVGIPSKFGKFAVSKRFMHNRGYNNFPSKFFCLSARKLRKGTH